MNKKGESKFPRGIGRIEELIRIVEGSADPVARDYVWELARVILDLHGMGLCKMVEFIAQAGEPGAGRSSTHAPETTWSGACSSCTTSIRRGRKLVPSRSSPSSSRSCPSTGPI